MAKRTYKAIAEYYDPEYEHLDYLKRDVPFLMKRMGSRPRKVLEVAVGTGRAAIPLAEAGHTVVGVDNDPGVLAIATRKRDFVGLTGKRLRLVKADARSLRVGLGGTGGKVGGFDWCVLLFNTLLAFTTIDELDAVVGNCARHLKRGGRFWVDVFNPDLSLIAERESYGLDPVTFHVPSLERTVSRVTDVEDLSPGVRQVTFHYRWFEQGEERHEAVRFELAWMMPRELVLLLERHGLDIEGMWGDYDASDVTTTSPRIIVQARKS